MHNVFNFWNIFIIQLGLIIAPILTHTKGVLYNVSIPRDFLRYPFKKIILQLILLIRHRDSYLQKIATVYFKMTLL
jgi:hypothetical protein